MSHKKKKKTGSSFGDAFREKKASEVINSFRPERAIQRIVSPKTFSSPNRSSGGRRNRGNLGNSKPTPIIPLKTSQFKQKDFSAKQAAIKFARRRIEIIKRNNEILVTKSKKLSKDIDKGIEKTSQNLQRAKEKLRKSKERGETNKLLAEAGGFQLALSQSVVGTAAALKVIPSLVGNVYELRKKPERERFVKKVRKFASKELKKINKLKDPKVRQFVKIELKRKVIQAESFAKNNPGEVIGFLAGEVLLMKGTGKATKITGKAFNKVLDIGTVKIINRGGKKFVQVKNRGSLFNKRTRGNIKAGIEFEVGGVKEGAESLSKAARRAGKTANAVSAQADEISRFEKNILNKIRRRAKIRKPLPLNVEKGLSEKTLMSLNKFDKGQLNLKEIIDLNKKIRSESLNIKGVKGVQPKGIDLLERGTFFDSDNLLRLSRFAIEKEKEGTFRDLLRPGLLRNKRTRGNLRGGEIFESKATLFPGRKARPNILSVKEIIENFPNNKDFRKMKRKFDKGIPLNKDELAKLSTFQSTPSGLLKPLGSTTFNKGIEREVTGAAGDFIKFKRKLATLSYKGLRIPIREVQIIKGKLKKKGLSKFAKKIEALKIKLKNTRLNSEKIEIKRLIKNNKKKQLINKQKKIKKNLKRDLKRSRRSPKKNTRRRRNEKTKRVFPLKRKVVQVLSRSLRKNSQNIRRKSLLKNKRPKGISTLRAGGTKTARTGGTKTARTGIKIKPTIRKSIRAIAIRKIQKSKEKPKIIARFPKGFKKKILNKKIQTHYVVTRKKGKLVKLNARPLSLKDAKDYLAYSLDNRLTRTAFFIPAGRSNIVVKLPPKMKGYFSKIKNKLRPYRIKQKKKRALLRGYIEKTPHILDSIGEKAELKRRIAQSKRRRKTTSRRIKR